MCGAFVTLEEISAGMPVDETDRIGLLFAIQNKRVLTSTFHIVNSHHSHKSQSVCSLST